MPARRGLTFGNRARANAFLINLSSYKFYELKVLQELGSASERQVEIGVLLQHKLDFSALPTS
jgi:hypothetical protein